VSDYLIMNPISKIVDKPRSQFTKSDMIKLIGHEQIQRIVFHYTALDGKLKELKLPVVNQYQAERILADGERVDGSSLFTGLIDVALSDLYVVPLYKTAFLNPFEPGTLNIICRYMTRDGDLAPFALDTILHKAHNLLNQSTGLDLHVMGELEFFLLKSTDDQLYPNPKQRGYQSSSPFVQTGAILNEMVRHIAQITGAIKYAHSEVGYVEKVRSDLIEIRGKQAEQLEIEFLPMPAEDMGDILVLARWLIRNIAYKNGCVATFTPKLEEGVAGNGFHIHMGLMKDGKNIMNNPNGDLSKKALKLIGGLTNYAASLTAFGNTVSSAYLRLVPNQEAPTRICWSDQNRSAMIRVPLGWSKTENLAKSINPQQSDKFLETEGRQTVELRSPDGSALVHLLLAGIVMAAEYGLNDSKSLGTAKKLKVEGNIFKSPELMVHLPILPKSCVESASILEKNRQLFERSDIFPKSIIDYMCNMLRNENDEFINQRLADLPADDRLHETRIIMHKDLHKH
jgi:glutamine synthetase